MFYNLGVSLYGLALKMASLVHPKAKKWVDGRRNFWDNLPDVSDKKVIWFHCASLGEYDQGKPIMEAWRKRNPTDYILVTFFSPSGYENMAKKSVGDYTCYLPLDTPTNAQKFIQYFQPKVTFFIKYEIWINHLTEAKKIGSKIYSISASFRKNQRFFKWYGSKFRKALSLFDHIFVQREESKTLLATIGIHQVTVSGDTRFDRVIQRAREEKVNEIIEPWARNSEILVVGSSWEDDERIIIPYINDFKMRNQVILAPHEVNSKHVDEITRQLKVSYQLYTNLQKGEPLKPTTIVLILDCIGVLADAYRYGTIAYVGGGFGTGLHNILEPAAFGLPVIFGPKHDKFPEAKEFINAGIGKDIGNGNEFFEAYKFFQKQTDIRRKVNEFVGKNVGATEKIMEVLEQV